MNITIEDIDRVKELLLISKKNDIFNMTTREFNEFENKILDILHEELDIREQLHIPSKWRTKKGQMVYRRLGGARK